MPNNFGHCVVIVITAITDRLTVHGVCIQGSPSICIGNVRRVLHSRITQNNYYSVIVAMRTLSETFRFFISLGYLINKYVLSATFSTSPIIIILLILSTKLFLHSAIAFVIHVLLKLNTLDFTHLTYPSC